MPKLQFSSNLQFTPFISQGRIALLIGWLMLCNLALTIATFGVQLRRRANPTVDLLKHAQTKDASLFLQLQLTFTGENNVASWVSSMVLLSVSAIAVLCFLVDRQLEKGQDQQWLRYGWLVLAMVFLILSADELGSFHERIGWIATPEKALGWVPVFQIPIGIVAGLLIVFAWLRAGRYWQVWSQILVGVLLLLINPSLEQMQRLIQASGIPAAQQQAFEISTLVEESAELLGATAFLSACLVYSASRTQMAKAIWAQKSIHFKLQVPTQQAWNALSLFAGFGLLSLLMIQRLQVKSWTEGWGIPDNWFPAASFFLAALVCGLIRDSQCDRRGFRYCLYGLYGVFCGIVSMYYGMNYQGALVHRYLVEQLQLETVQFWLTIAALVLSGWLAILAKPWWLKVGFVIWAMLFDFIFAYSPQSLADSLDWMTGIGLLLLLLLQLKSRPLPAP